MARKKDVNAEIKEVANEQVKDNSYKAWDERSNEEKKRVSMNILKQLLLKLSKRKRLFGARICLKKI
ncbi:hypothetical protein ACNANW_08880 (plasmid) [Campylobacter jejuni]|nr:hypothetical protein [Campylobacter jejuni]EJY2761397.1 hypothetical protein [Campylobacter jejuni]